MFRSAMLQSNRVVVPGGAWTPASLTNLVGWWRAQDEPTGVMSSWTDLSGNGHHLTQATAAKKPINTAAQINGKAAVVFDGVDDWMKAVFTLVQPEEIWIVGRNRGGAGNRYFTDGGASVDSMDIYTNPATAIQTYCGAYGPSVTISTSTYMAINTLFNGASSLLVVDNGTPATGNPGTGNGGGVTVGATQNGMAGFADIDVAEIFITTAATTAVEKSDIYSYLNSQYGWTL